MEIPLPVIGFSWREGGFRWRTGVGWMKSLETFSFVNIGI